jgi:hypothetical protein
MSARAGGTEIADSTPISPTDGNEARTLLDRTPALKCRCDLDLLVFFARHRRVLLTSAELARMLGYSLKEITRSRDVLVAAGWLTRGRNPTCPQRMYALDPQCMNGGPIPAIVALASTARGRLSLRLALSPSLAGSENGASVRAGDDATPVMSGRTWDGGSRKRAATGNGIRTRRRRGHADG